MESIQKDNLDRMLANFTGKSERDCLPSDFAYSHSETIMRILHYNAKKHAIACTLDKIHRGSREIDMHLLQTALSSELYLDKHTLKRRIMSLFRRQRFSAEERKSAAFIDDKQPIDTIECPCLASKKRRPSILAMVLQRIAAGGSTFRPMSKKVFCTSDHTKGTGNTTFEASSYNGSKRAVSVSKSQKNGESPISPIRLIQIILHQQ